MLYSKECGTVRNVEQKGTWYSKEHGMERGTVRNMVWNVVQ